MGQRAKGDGVADDTEAIQAALNTGKTVYIPSGIYACYGELAMTIAGTRIVGAGMGGGYRGSLATPITNWTHNTTLLFKDNTRPSPAPKQGFAHNEESSHERGKEYRDQGSLFTYAPNDGEVEPNTMTVNVNMTVAMIAEMNVATTVMMIAVIGTKTGIRKGLNIRSRNGWA